MVISLHAVGDIPYRLSQMKHQLDAALLVFHLTYTMMHGSTKLKLKYRTVYRRVRLVPVFKASIEFHKLDKIPEKLVG